MAQTVPAESTGSQPAGPPRNPGFFPLDQVHAGLTATAWTVFQGATPEPMQVEILGVLRGARGPGQDLILARLRGAKPEYTGVVAGMSGSPVYIEGKLAGALSYRIGQFTKEPIAGITPIEQMLEVRNQSSSEIAGGWNAAGGGQTTRTTSALSASSRAASADLLDQRGGSEAADNDGSRTFRPMETPLVMNGLAPEAIRFWQDHTAGTSLDSVSAGGSSVAGGASAAPASAASRALEPGSSVSMQLVRGDVEIAATCTVTWLDPRQLLACGHPVLGAGPVSLPMTAAEIVATVASPLNAFKIVNTGATIGAFTEDRESAIHGVFGAQARMIPMHIAVDAPTGPRKVNVEILDLPSLTPLAMQVVLLNALTQTNESSEALSYHLTGSIELTGYPPMPLDLWGTSAQGAPASFDAALLAGQQFTRLYANAARQDLIRQVDVHVEAAPRRVQVILEKARLVSGDIAHAGDRVEIEATLQPWQQPERNVRVAFRLPARLTEGNLRVLVSDGATLDRALIQPRFNAPPPGVEALLDAARSQHRADRLYVSLLVPDAQAGVEGQSLADLPLSMANALEPMRDAQSASLNGESVELAGETRADGVLSGFQVLNIHIAPGGGVN